MSTSKASKKRVREEKEAELVLVPEKDWKQRKPQGLDEGRIGEEHEDLKERVTAFFEGNRPWFQRFGKQYPKTAHYNGDHFMSRDHEDVRRLVHICAETMLEQRSHAALRYVASNTAEGCPDSDDVSVAVMRHKGAERVPMERDPTKTKLVKPSWGLGAHPDTWAPDGEGLVMMITLGRTDEHNRQFRFSCPVLGYCHTIETPPGSIVVFTEDAYDKWEHESLRTKWQDGTCYSLTVRIKEIDSYYGWSSPEGMAPSMPRNDLTSVGYAKRMQRKRIREHGLRDA